MRKKSAHQLPFLAYFNLTQDAAFYQKCIKIIIKTCIKLIIAQYLKSTRANHHDTVKVNIIGYPTQPTKIT